MEHISPCFNSLSSEWIPKTKQYSRFLLNCISVNEKCIFWNNDENLTATQKNTFFFNGKRRPIKFLIYIWLKGIFLSEKNYEFKATCDNRDCIYPFHIIPIKKDKNKLKPKNRKIKNKKISNFRKKFTKEKVFEILDEIRASFPDEIKQARWIVKERQEMLDEAEKEATRIQEEAQQKAESMAAETEIARLAEEQASQTVEEAQAKEREIRLGAEDYADEMLANLEVNLGKLLTAVQRGRDRLQGKAAEPRT
ncbi:hypothetical protein LCGC14_1773110 [marine sediment metagenome]|uniref:Uncharacterized protein n=1 Tax=marine sediment metagenome TaxID=412755 RepID=A0A0F9GXQ5_9ZZZZ